MTEGQDVDPIDTEHADPAPIASLSLDDVVLPIYDLQAFNDADLHRVSSFVTNFGSWHLPPEVATALAAGKNSAALEWIHDTGELVLLGGTPTEGELSAELPGFAGAAAEFTPAFLGGEAGATKTDGSGMVREYFKGEVMPPGSRVALMAHIEHGPAVHELLWGWHHEHRTAEGWNWLVERLARLEDASGQSDHLG
ncbi:MAG TPA: hypothetical protein VII50_01415 [Acidothermaceae bacterium]|jgi:hypothetical protein